MRKPREPARNGVAESPGRGQGAGPGAGMVLGLFAGLLAGLLAAFGAFILFGPGKHILKPTEPISTAGLSPGQAAIEAFRCPYGDTRFVSLHGKPDSFAQDEPESPLGPHKRHRKYPGLLAAPLGARSYDDLALDKTLLDYFELAKPLSRARIIICLDFARMDENDAVVIGDFMPGQNSLNPAFSVTYSRRIQSPGWRREGGLLIGDFAALKDKQGKSLLSYQNAPNGPGVLDMRIYDDVPVDFAALVSCVTPKGKRGTSFVDFRPVQEIPEDIMVLGCNADVTRKPCNPFTGDTVCASRLPLACVKDSPKQGPPEGLYKSFQKNWSQAEMALTEPKSGEDFATIADVNAFCRARFGPGWRVANYHDGGAHIIAGWRHAPRDARSKQRIWINVKDQPKANCWSNDPSSIRKAQNGD